MLDFHTRVLGYRPPATDGARGGSAQFDVYLSQLADDGLYGFCAPEEKVPGQRFVYSGYCVLDNDFVEFPRGPLPSLQVTAAHEFFHAIQFAYDATEDRWFMEATATWAEERYADDIDDNRQYLTHGQLGRPAHTRSTSTTPSGRATTATGSSSSGSPSATASTSSTRSGTRPTRRRARRTATPPRPSPRCSAGRARPSRTFYARFAAGNQLPAQFYDEGAAYRPAPVERTVRLRPRLRDVTERRRLDHLTSARLPLRAGGLAARHAGGCGSR